MATLNFSINQNQVVWDQWFNRQLEGVDTEAIKTKKVSLAQYKPILKELEATTGKGFSQVSTTDLETFVKATNKQDKINHLRGFLIASATAGIVNLSKDVLAWLIPDMYKDLVSLLLK